MAGRPTKFTPALGERICKLVSAGVSIEAAATSQGVSERTVYNWLERGKRGERAYAEFAIEARKAMGSVEARLSMNVVARAKDDWRAGAWYLERRTAERFGEQGKLERKLEEIVEKVLDAARAEMDPDSHQRLLRKLAREGRED